jgi:D-amino-acid dehydrogenase
MGEAQILHRLRENGWLFLYRSAAAYAGSQLARDTMDHFGVATETLDRKALSDLEPALRPIFDSALWIKDASSVDDPSQVVQAYARLFVARGGLIRQAGVAGLQAHQDKHWKVLDDAGGHHEAERVVVALGPWSKAFLAPLGISVPMAFERGYHMHYGSAEGMTLKRPVYDTGGAYVLSPMERGLRLSTGVELDDCEAPPRHAQLELAEKAARQAISMGERMERDVWLGRRPTLPDSRPIIGEMPGRPGLWLAFGHQHVGFSTGPGTAALLGAQMYGDVLPIDPEPFRAGRFLSA